MVELRERHSYLRMQLTIKDRAVKVEMRFYVEKILLDHEDYELIWFDTASGRGEEAVPYYCHEAFLSL